MSNRRISVVRPSQIFDSFLDEFMNSPILSRSQSSMDINVIEKSDRVLIEAKLPGFDKDEISIQVEDNMLIIEGNKSNEKEEGEMDGEYYLREYSTESVKRSVSLPSKVDGEKAEAEMKNGILRVSLPKQPEVMPKKISIKTE